MKTNTLANCSGVNAETIRKYRDRGLLRPACNIENGYYEYSQADFLNLLYIRKLRGANLSLDTIESTYYCDGGDMLRQEYEKTLDELQRQIRELKRKEMMLRLTYRHYERDAASSESIGEIQSFGTKYDIYFDRDGISEEMKAWIGNIDLFTMVINIDQRFFETETLPEEIPFRVGIGTYGSVLEEEGIAVPDTASVFPQGRYVSFFLEIENLHCLKSEKLDEARRYLRENGLQPDSSTTAYLYRVTFAENGYHFHFCVRLRVK
ncbi:MAG: MerR family transcriptional regulator [Oscillospiraceae bacterium]|nr:MerR family transcriptional regulator [Oscillospiraceae bacterium]